VYEEQKRYNRQLQTAEENHNDQIAKEKKQLQERLDEEADNLQKRIDQERKAYEKQMRDAKEADERRIADMKENLAYQQEIEDEDRALRLKRMAEDHQAQLDELDANHARRMEQIQKHEEQEIKQAEENHLEELNKLGIYNKAWKDLHDAGMLAILKAHAEWLKKMADAYHMIGPSPFNPNEQDMSGGYIGGPGGVGSTDNLNEWLKLTDPSTWPQRAAGGPIQSTGPIWAHANEFMLNAQTTSALHRAMGGMTQSKLVQSVGGKSLTLGAINIYGAPGQSEKKLAEEVRTVLIDILEKEIA
jgi:hypothetical protein